MQTKRFDNFGSSIPYAEPYWYQGLPSVYYTEEHVAFRAKCRDFVEKELKPHLDEWIAKKEYPMSLHEKAYAAGISGIIYPKEYGGSRPEKPDYFMEFIRLDEFSRLGGGHVLGQEGINSMALPPIINYGSQRLKEMVVRPVVEGKKSCSLAISEPYAGSDVAGIKTTARREGNVYVVNGIKKWITGGAKADFFTTAVRTGEAGMLGISLLLIPRDLPGISVRRMETQFDSAHSTCMVTFEDVRVPVENLIGQENIGFKYVVENFNHERWVISVGGCRLARECYREAFEWALRRETFGKPLIRSQVIRQKLADMARQIESLHDFNERVAMAFQGGASEAVLGGLVALLKVQASRTLEFCAREAVQIFGGSGIVREGSGKIVERIYREVRGMAIPGGSEEILLDFAIRAAESRHHKLEKQKSKL